MITIRKARPEDLPELLDFEQQLINHERPMDPFLIQDRPMVYYDLPAFFADENTEIFVAETEEKLVACGYGTVKKNRPKYRESRQGYIGFIFVHPEFRGRQLADRILKTLIAHFKEKGISDVRLTVYPENYGAIKAYEKAGFTQNLIEMRLDTEA